MICKLTLKALGPLPRAYSDIDWTETCLLDSLHSYCHTDYEPAEPSAKQLKKQQQLVSTGKVTPNQLQMVRFVQRFQHTHMPAVNTAAFSFHALAASLYVTAHVTTVQQFHHGFVTAGSSRCAAAGKACGWCRAPMLQFLPQPCPNDWRYNRVHNDPLADYQDKEEAGQAPAVERPSELHYELQKFTRCCRSRTQMVSWHLARYLTPGIRSTKMTILLLLCWWPWQPKLHPPARKTYSADLSRSRPRMSRKWRDSRSFKQQLQRSRGHCSSCFRPYSCCRVGCKAAVPDYACSSTE